MTLIQDMGVDFTAGEPVPPQALEVVMPTMASESERAVTVAAPAHNGEPLYVRIVPADGGDPVLTPILVLTFVAKSSMSERADFEQTHMGEFDGIQIGTGSSTLDGKPARMVVTEWVRRVHKGVGEGAVRGEVTDSGLPRDTWDCQRYNTGLTQTLYAGCCQDRLIAGMTPC